MPQNLSERPEELVRQFFVDNLRTGEMETYDPQQDNPQASDFLPISADWSLRGDYYPHIFVRETDGPTIPNSGETGFNGMQGDGSGLNQYNIRNITVSCQAVEGPDSQGGPYLNNTPAETLVKELYDECHHQIQNNATTAISDAIFVGMTPPTTTRNNQETDSGSTITWIQEQGTVFMGVLNTP